MTSVKDLNSAIADKQRALDAVEKERQAADPDLAESMQPQRDSIAKEISDMQAKLPGAIEQERKDAADEAAHEQKKKDRGIGMSDLFG